MESLKRLIEAHPFFADFDPDHLDTVVGCAKNCRYAAGQALFSEGDEANDFYLVRAGRVAIELAVHHKPTVVKTAGPGEIIGWNFLVPPHIRPYAARAVELSRVIALDGACLRKKAEADPALGFALLKKFAALLDEELTHAWVQQVDAYGPVGG
jgi:CRP-like cAMP-binding protein